MEQFYRLLNAAPMPLWLALLLVPRHPATVRASRSSLPAALAALPYVAALLLALRRGPGDGLRRLATLDGLRGLLATREGALAAWSHMLALDLFTGSWIAREADRLHAPGWVRLPSLLLTLTSGPLGLLLFLLWRSAAHGTALPGEGG